MLTYRVTCEIIEWNSQTRRAKTLRLLRFVFYNFLVSTERPSILESAKNARFERDKKRKPKNHSKLIETRSAIRDRANRKKDKYVCDSNKKTKKERKKGRCDKRVKMRGVRYEYKTHIKIYLETDRLTSNLFMESLFMERYKLKIFNFEIVLSVAQLRCHKSDIDNCDVKNPLTGSPRATLSSRFFQFLPR